MDSHSVIGIVVIEFQRIQTVLIQRPHPVPSRIVPIESSDLLGADFALRSQADGDACRYRIFPEKRSRKIIPLIHEMQLRFIVLDACQKSLEDSGIYDQVIGK